MFAEMERGPLNRRLYSREIGRAGQVIEHVPPPIRDSPASAVLLVASSASVDHSASVGPGSASRWCLNGHICLMTGLGATNLGAGLVGLSHPKEKWRLNDPSVSARRFRHREYQSQHALRFCKVPGEKLRNGSKGVYRCPRVSCVAPQDALSSLIARRSRSGGPGFGQ
jgi:hypothetical protein